LNAQSSRSSAMPVGARRAGSGLRHPAVATHSFGTPSCLCASLYGHVHTEVANREETEMDNPLEPLKELETHLRMIGDKRGLFGCLCNQAQVLTEDVAQCVRTGDKDRALLLLAGQENLTREIVELSQQIPGAGDRRGALQRNLEIQIALLIEKRDGERLPRLRALLDENEELCKGLGRAESLRQVQAQKSYADLLLAMPTANSRGNAAALCRRAIQLIRSGAKTEALDVFEQAVRADPTYEYAWLDYAQCLIDVNQLPRAAEVLAKGARQFADNSEFLKKLRVVNAKLGKEGQT
jgi:hypothetical protein